MVQGPSTKLRCGILCDTPRLQAWQWRCLELLRQVPGCEPVVVVLNAKTERRIALSQRLLHLGRKGLLGWALFDHLVASRPSSATSRLDPPSWFRALPILDCEVEYRGRYSQHFPGRDVERLRMLELDFVVKFGFGIIRGDVLEVARYGVWSFHHDDIAGYRGAPPGFWEIAEGDPVTGAVLQRLTDRLDGGIVLKRGFWKTVVDSYVRNRDQTYWGSAVWPAQVCRDIQSGHADYLGAKATPPTGRLYRYPSDAHVVGVSLRMLKNWLVRQFDDVLFSEIWNVGVIEATVQSVAEHGIRDRIRWLRPCPRDRYIADPFGVILDGHTWIFVEDYSHDRGRGVISARQLGDVTQDDDWVPVLEGPHHLSFPYVFEHESGVYCLPECAESGAVTLYRADQFPRRWKPVATLLPDFPGIDPTLLFHDGRWWLFCTDQSQGDCSHLHLFHAASLFGPYEPHRNNPVKIDVRGSRSAGPLFRLRGAWIRPSQNDAQTYGGSITFNRIVQLDADVFCEEPIGELLPERNGPYPCGVHTIHGVGAITMVDGKRRALLPRLVLRRLASKAVRLARVTRIARPARALW